VSKLIFILKFIFKTKEGKYRKSLLFSYFCIILSTIIISLTYSITNSLKSEVEELINSFSYNHSLKILNTAEVSFFDKSINSGMERIVLYERDDNQYKSLYKSLSYKDFDTFCNKLPDKYLSSYPVDEYLDNQFYKILISEKVAESTHSIVGDIVKLSAILDNDISQLNFNSEHVLIKGIYVNNFSDIDLIIPDELARSIFTKSTHTNFYFDNPADLKSFININNLSDNNISSNSESSLKKWIDIEMNIYIALSYLTIIISAFIIYINSILSYLEKTNQFIVLSYLGLKKTIISKYLILTNIVLGTIMITIGLFITYFLIYLSNKFNLLILLIPEPFKFIPMHLGFKDILILMLIIIIVLLLSSIVPFLKYTKNKIISDI